MLGRTRLLMVLAISTCIKSSEKGTYDVSSHSRFLGHNDVLSPLLLGVDYPYLPLGPYRMYGLDFGYIAWYRISPDRRLLIHQGN
jgi:hypothetical protein